VRNLHRLPCEVNLPQHVLFAALVALNTQAEMDNPDDRHEVGSLEELMAAHGYSH
jgi:hypothetical protein